MYKLKSLGVLATIMLCTSCIKEVKPPSNVIKAYEVVEMKSIVENISGSKASGSFFITGTYRSESSTQDVRILEFFVRDTVGIISYIKADLSKFNIKLDEYSDVPELITIYKGYRHYTEPESHYEETISNINKYYYRFEQKPILIINPKYFNGEIKEGFKISLE